MKSKRTGPIPMETIERLYDGNAESVCSGPEKRLMELIDGDKPRNKKEARIQQQANKIMKSGKDVDIPSM